MPKQELAREFARSFETRTRDNGESFVYLEEGAPDWMQDALRDAHGDMFPDDWRFRAIQNVAYSLSDWDDWEDCAHDIADNHVEVYTSALTAWLSSNTRRVAYCDAAIDRGLCAPTEGVDHILAAGQYQEFVEIAEALVAAFEKLESSSE